MPRPTLARRLFVALLTIVALSAATCSREARSEDHSTEARAQQLVEEFRKQHRLPGVAASVQLGDRRVWTGTSGFANRNHQLPVEPSTAFRVGSVSKSLTAVALGLLIEEGSVDLDLPVQNYVPSFPIKPEGEITLRLLASHQSGVPHYERSDFVNKEHYNSATHALDKFQDRPLLFRPEADFTYSSFGWNLLGAALEGASGQNFLELMRERVFGPLELRHTLPDRPDIEGRAVPYARLAFLTFRAPKIDNSDAWPSAGFVSTTEDLVTLGEAMLDARLLSKPTIDLLWSKTTTGSGEATDYGLGWQWTELAGRPAVGHGGSHVGATANLWILPAERLVISVATNTNAPPGSLGELTDELVSLFLEPRAEP